MEALCRDIAHIREDETLRTNLRRDSFTHVEKSAGETHTQTKCWLYEVIAQKTEGRRMEFYQESGFRPYQMKMCFKTDFRSSCRWKTNLITFKEGM